MPRRAPLARSAGAPNRRVYKPGELDQIVGDRLAELQKLVADNGARLILLKYPSPGSEDDWKMVQRVAETRHITLLKVVDSIPASDLEDPVHLNPEGSRKFTELLGQALGALLTSFQVH